MAEGKSCCHELCRCRVWANQGVGRVASAGLEVSAGDGPGHSARRPGRGFSGFSVWKDFGAFCAKAKTSIMFWVSHCLNDPSPHPLLTWDSPSCPVRWLGGCHTPGRAVTVPAAPASSREGRLCPFMWPRRGPVMLFSSSHRCHSLWVL